MRSTTTFALTALASPAFAQTILWEVPNTLPEPSPVAAYGDRDGDGWDDFVTMAPSGGADTRIRVHSGRDLTTLLDFVALGSSSVTSGGLDVLDDFDGDGVPDFVFSNAGGYPVVYSGVGGAPIFDLTVSSVCKIGMSQDRRGVGDLDGDGLEELVWAQREAWISTEGGWEVRRGGSDAASIGAVHCASCNVTSPQSDAWSADGVGDVDGDGTLDFALVQLNTVRVLSGTDCGVLGELSLDDSILASVRGLGDVDGDGRGDFVVLAPIGGVQGAHVVSGAGLTVLRTHPAQIAVARVAGPGDLDCDGRGDVLVSDYFDNTGGTQAGVVRLYSGIDGALLQEVFGSAGDWLGHGIAGAGDVDADGVLDWMASARAYTRVYAGPGPAVAGYCTAKINSAGCAPQTGWGGTPTLSGPDDFVVRANQALPGKSGLFFWGESGPAALPFLGGTLCVQPPLVRTLVQAAGGSGTCGGTYAFWFSQGYALAAGLAGGQRIHGQWWMRDPAAPDGTGVGLSNGIAFDLCE